MYVSRTISIKMDDLVKIQNKVDEGNFASISEYIQLAVKKQLK